MANLPAGLLSSGDYSDFTLVCEGQEFQVHKAIVCSQSPVIAAALKGGFKEAQTNTFHVVDFDLTTVKCMLDYMYTGKYEKTPPGCRDGNQDQEDGKNERANSNVETWIHHGLVNCIADYFGLSKLAKLTTATLDELIQKKWSADDFCNMLCGTHSKAWDKDFRVMLATQATNHLSELTARGLFDEADRPSDDMTSAILWRCAERLDKWNALTARAKQQDNSLRTIVDFVDGKEFFCKNCDFPREFCFILFDSGGCAIYCARCEWEV